MGNRNLVVDHRSPIEKMIDASVICSECGKQGIDTCGCHELCTCGAWVKKGQVCTNPNSRACLFRLQRGKYNRQTGRWE